jgi:hypothetical protein
MNVAVRINGNAPAWPVLLESKHPFYAPFTSDNLASVSYSILAKENKNSENTIWEVLVDAGHNSAPFLIQNGNRIPDAIVLTHAHNDHVLGVDWIVQSFHYKHKKSIGFPLYSTKGVWKDFLKLFPYLKDAIKHNELLPGQKTAINEIPDMEVTAFPVYHGKNSKGASMLFFEGKIFHPVIITGDMLCPLLRKKDYHSISRAAAMFIDTNNRFPDPHSNHASFVPFVKDSEAYAEKLLKWFKTMSLEKLTYPHTGNDSDQSVQEYFSEFLKDWQKTNELPHSILDFNEYLNIREVYLMHYFGYYDKINYNEELMDRQSLENWANQVAKEKQMKEVVYKVPQVGNLIYL